MTKKLSKAPRLSKCFSALLIVILLEFCTTAEKKEAVDAVVPSATSEMILFFPKKDGTGTIKVGVTVEDSRNKPSRWMELMLGKLSQAPNGETLRLFSKEAKLYGMFSEGETLYLDFSSDMKKSDFTSIEMEQMGFNAFLSSLKANFPFAQQVKILVEHEDADTIWGHIYARQAFSLGI